MESSSQFKVTDYIKSSDSLQNGVSPSSDLQTLHTPSLSKTVIESSQLTVQAVLQASSTQMPKNIHKSVSSEVLKSYKDQKLDRMKRSAYATQSVMSDISSDRVFSLSKSKFTSMSVDLKTHVDTETVKPTVQITKSSVSKPSLTPTKVDNSDSKTSISLSYSSKMLAFPNVALRQVQPAPLATMSVIPSSSDNQMDTTVTSIKSQSVKDVLSSSDMKSSENVSMDITSVKVSESRSLKSNTVELSTSFSKTDNMDMMKQTTLATLDKLSNIKTPSAKTNVDIISSTTAIDLTPSETVKQTQIGDALTPSKTLVQLDQIMTSSLPGSITDNIAMTTSQPVGSISLTGVSPVIPVSSSAFVAGGGVIPPVSSSVIPPLLPVNPSGLPGSSTTGAPTPPPAVLPNSFALILGVSLCGVGMLLFLVTLTIVCCRKKRPAKKNQEELRSHDFWVSTTAASDIAMANVPDPLPNFENVSEGVPNADDKPNEHKVFVKPPRRRKPRGGINVFPRDPNEGKYRALYTFEVTQEGQLAFRKGDIIDVLEQADEWWKGRTGGKEGWFPGSYVKEIRPRSTLFSDSDDNGKPEKKEPVLPTPTDKDSSTKQSVSSFLLSKDSKPYTSVSRSHSDRQSPHRQATPKRESWALGKEVSIPKLPHQESTKKSQDYVDGVVQSPIKEPRYGSGVDGMKFKVMYHYMANFKSEINLEEGEIVTAYEKDKNGWMRGKKDRTGEEGWFPAVYVEECTKQDLEEIEKQLKKKDEEKDDIYRKLDPNHNNSADHDWICIEHVAICPYAAEKTSDLSFDIGDKVLVFQTLENGWWLGCRGDEVGWFPGAYVELVYEEEGSQSLDVTKPSQPAYEAINGMSTFSSQKSDRSSYLSVHSNKSDDELSISSAASHSSAAESGSGRKPRPKRKAPKPPVSDSLGGSKLPTPIKPARPPPPQPGIHHSTPEHRDVSEALGTSNQKDIVNSSVEIMITPETSGNLSQKPVVPKRFVKPKLIKIPRRKLELHTASKGSSPQTRSPPPARPAPPKLLPPQYSQKSVVQNGVQDRSWSQDHQASPDSRTIKQTWSPVNGFSLEHDRNTSSLEDMSSFSQNISGVNGTLDHNVNLSRDIDHDRMEGNSVVKIGEQTNKHSTVPKLRRQDALSSTGQNSFQEDDNAHHSDQESENNASPRHEKHISRIPQFNNGHGSSPVKSSKNEEHDVLENHSIEDIKPPWEDEEFKENVNSVSHLENDHELHEYLDDLSDPSTSKDIAKPPVAPKPKGIPPPKVHYKGSMSSDSANKHEQSRIPQESPSSRRKMSGQKPNVPASPTRERKSGLPVSKSSKLPRQKSSERPMQQKSVSGNEPERQNSLDDNSPSRSRSKPNRPGKPPDSTNTNKSKKLSDTSPSRLPMMKSFQSPNSVTPKREEEKKTSPQKSNTKGKRSIPVAKPARPPPPNSPPNSPPPTKTKSKSQLPRFTSFGHGQHSTTDDGKKPRKSSLRKALRSYQGQSDAELSFDEGSFITEISQDEGNSGWYTGMLADGTKGLFHSSLVEEVSTSNMSTEV